MLKQTSPRQKVCSWTCDRKGVKGGGPKGDKGRAQTAKTTRKAKVPRQARARTLGSNPRTSLDTVTGADMVTQEDGLLVDRGDTSIEGYGVAGVSRQQQQPTRHVDDRDSTPVHRRAEHQHDGTNWACTLVDQDECALS